MDLQKRIGEFGDTVGWGNFPGVINHLKEEFEELASDEENGYDIEEETADCAICLFTIAHAKGFDLLKAVEAKQTINESRNWLPPNEDGVVHHKGHGK